MSGTTTIEVPKGLDKLSADEQRLMDSMRADETEAPEPEPSRPAPEATPEAEIEIEEPAAAEPGQSKTVPHQAFHAERERRKAAEVRAQQLETESAANMARLQERMNTVLSIAQVAAQPPAAPTPVAEEVPDVNTDPVGHFQAVAAQLRRTVEEQGAILQGFTQRSQQNNQIAEMRNWCSAQETAFQTTEPSYLDAMRHLEQSRRAELIAAGVSDPVMQAQMIGQDMMNIAAKARQENANPAERMFNISISRGFQKPAVPGAIPPIDAAVVDPVERQVAARNNATSISSVNGVGPGTRLSVEKIGAMSDKQFEAFTSKLRDSDPEAFRNLMGA